MTAYDVGDLVFDELLARTARVVEILGALVSCAPDPEVPGYLPWVAESRHLRLATDADRIRMGALVANTSARMRGQM